MSDTPQGPSWWQASEDEWEPYPPPDLPPSSDRSLTEPEPAHSARSMPSARSSRPRSSNSGRPAPRPPRAGRSPVYGAIGVLTGVAVIVGAGVYLTRDGGSHGDSDGGAADESTTTQSGGVDGGESPETSGSQQDTGADPAFVTAANAEERPVGESITLLEYGITSVEEAGGHAIYYGVRVRNDNERARESVVLRLSILDENGNLLDQEMVDSRISRLEPGEEGVLGGRLGGMSGAYPAPGATIEVETDGFLLENAEPDPERDAALTGGVTSVEGSGAEFSVGYEATSTHPESVDVTVTALYRNSEGQILAASSDTQVRLPAQSTIEGVISNLPRVGEPSPEHLELYVTVDQEERR